MLDRGGAARCTGGPVSRNTVARPSLRATKPVMAGGSVGALLRGRTVDEALAIKNTDIVNELALPPVKIHCSVLAEDAIKAAIADYKKKQGEA